MVAPLTYVANFAWAPVIVMELSSVPYMLVANLSLCMIAVSVSQSMGAARGWLALGGYHSIPGQN